MFDALKRHWDAQKQQPIMALFEAKNRAEQFSVQADDLLLDYSKTRIDAIARKGLLDLAQARGLEERRLDMFQGAALNETEGRAVLHSALRNLDGPDVFVNGHNVMPDVQEALQRMTHFSEDLRRGRFQGPGGPITDIVNIGIGGSDLGPAMACLALAPYHDGPKCHFVSNVDGAHLHDILQNLDPTRSLFIIASKTFTTIETMTNAQTAKAWLAQHVTDPGAQFVALS
ncbi:MAG: glucose-6-phosphate isomerase, partial [Rhodobacteraceae bacterium]|nr:glucose-6-phosphate isomerase [Paracoccaceae bacterium]